MWQFILPPIVLSLTPAPQRMQASWTGPPGHKLNSHWPLPRSSSLSDVSLDIQP